MSLSVKSLTESGKGTGVEEMNLQTMSDLFSLELSQLLQQGLEENLLSVEPCETPNLAKVTIPICLIHQMAALPKCLLCIEE